MVDEGPDNSIPPIGIVAVRVRVSDYRGGEELGFEALMAVRGLARVMI